MNKITTTIGILLVGMIGMSYLYFSELKQSTNANDFSLNAISANAGIVYSFDHDKSFYEILSGQDLLQRILGTTKSSQLKSLKDNLFNKPKLADLLDGQKIYIGFIPNSTNQIDFLICTQVKQELDLQQFLTNPTLKALNPVPMMGLYKLTFADTNSVYIGVKDKLVAISNAAEQVQKAIGTKTNKNSGFATYMKANSGYNKNSLANLYLNFDVLPKFLKNILNNNGGGELAVLHQQRSYATLSYNFSKEKLLFNGNTELGNTNSYFSLFTHLPSQKITIDNILPQKTANYTTYAVTDYKNWHIDLLKWLEAQKGSERILKIKENISNKYGLDLEKIFPIYFKNQFITFQLSTGEKFGGIALSNGDKVGQLLLDLSTEYAPDIKVFREANIPYTYFGEPFKKFEKPFYTIIDNYLVMANYPSSIQVFLNNYRNNDLLINDQGYQHFNDQLSSATISFYINNKNSNTIFRRNLKPSYYKQYQASDGFNTFEAFSYQLSGDKGKFLSNVLLLNKQEEVTDTVQIGN
ncbi:hypothetical protein [Pedobacter insulae]|uniref:DUF3352 domain-containing protein n=1 Tax=Pedobacter insulae TaxID=414048 RepID=A0A1I2UJE3_9SPHI|nr:hypothetical protein [Pedobacter insulae]SFG77150.1 hypothetical protein SAMN04489864_102195 [Pedobacter insulae]